MEELIYDSIYFASNWNMADSIPLNRNQRDESPFNVRTSFVHNLLLYFNFINIDQAMEESSCGL